MSYYINWETSDEELQTGCQVDLHQRLENPDYTNAVSKPRDPLAADLFCLQEDNAWKEFGENLEEHDKEPYHGLRLQWIVLSAETDFHVKPGQDCFGTGLDGFYGENAEWTDFVTVTESENAWYSYGMGSRTFGFLRREMQWSSVSKNLTLCSITYIKPTQTASGFEIELKDGHGSSVLLELQELPITQENIKTLFDVWDYHVYSPSFYLN